MTCANQPLPGDRAELTTAQADADRVADLLMQILVGFNLTDFERERVLRKLNEKNQTISTPRAGTTLAAIVEFMKRERSRGQAFSLDEVRAAFTRNGITATPKEIYNALGYLARKHHIENIGYGQYQISPVQQEEK